MKPVSTTNAPNAAEQRDENFWLEEQYWGHRLWDQQTPWLIFLEFLCVAESALRHESLFDFQKSQYPSAFFPYSRIHLRNLLFNNEQLLLRIDREYPDSPAAWRTWLDWINNNAHGLDADDRDFSYLRSRFEQFHDFAQLVRALRSCGVENETNKRWSSRFLFPFGPSALFEDLNIARDGVRREYINFGRSGELLYHMVARSSRRAELATLFKNRLFRANDWNTLVRQLQPDEANSHKIGKRGVGTFLPYDAHPIFELLSEDWNTLLHLGFPGLDVVPHLVITGAFALFLYHLHTSAYLLGKNDIPKIICEVLAPRRGLVREQSIESFEANSTLSLEAIEKIFGQIERSPDWTKPGEQGDIIAARRRILQQEFRWDDYQEVSEPDELWKRFKEDAKARHRQHFGQVHRSYGRGIGLVSRRGTNKYRYAPTDAFLKAVLFSNVSKRMEFGEFLSRLYDRYGLVFGALEAERVLGVEDMDKKPFQANSLRLEQRLGSLGLLKRLSDACAYVENPYAE